MQISINSINGQCLLAIKTAQRLLVSGYKMDDQRPQRSQRSKMTITLKCNLCRPRAPGPSGWCRPCGPSAVPAKPGHAQPLWQLSPAAGQMAFGHHRQCVCLSILPSPSLFSCPPRQRTHTFVPPVLPLVTSLGGLQKGRTAVLLPAPLSSNKPCFLGSECSSGLLRAE